MFITSGLQKHSFCVEESMQNELTVDCTVSDSQCSMKAALLVSVKMLYNFLELLEIIRSPILVPLVLHMGLVLSVTVQVIYKSFCPGSCCLINDYLKFPPLGQCGPN